MLNHMKKLTGLVFLMVACFVNLPTAAATPLRLNYDITDLGGGLFDYEFTLTLDNHDNSFAVGQGWSWITFGDVLSAPSNLTGFTFDAGDFPVGSFTTGNFSSGGHNGPTLLTGGAGVTYWTPTTVGEFLQWSGTSTAYLDQGSLLFSTLITQNGAVAADYEIAYLGDFNGGTQQVPEQAAVLPLLVAGLLGLMAFRRKQAV